jgi:DNA-binding MarR family transcriptional regulator
MDTATAAPARVRDLPTWRIGLLHGRAHGLLSGHLGRRDFTGRQYRLLAAVVEAGEASQIELGRRAHLDRSDVVAAINVLVDRHLVRRVPDLRDRRRNTITATPAGVAMLEELDAIVADVQRELLARLSERDRHDLDRILTTLLADAPSTAQVQ